MSRPLLSVLVPTRDRPELVDQILRIDYGAAASDLEILISDNFVNKSCKEVVSKSTDDCVRYLRPDKALSVVDNCEFLLSKANGDYVTILTDKYLFFPWAVRKLATEILCGPNEYDIINWSYLPLEYQPGSLSQVQFKLAWLSTYVDDSKPTEYSPADELKRRRQFSDARNPYDYCRGKIFFGAYSRALIERVRRQYGRLFQPLCPDYSSTTLALKTASSCLEVKAPLVSMISFAGAGKIFQSDHGSLGYIKSVLSSAEMEKAIANLPINNLYSSTHNLYCNDYYLGEYRSKSKQLNKLRDLNVENFLYQCFRDIRRNNYSNKEVAVEQLGCIQNEINRAGYSVREFEAKLALEELSEKKKSTISFFPRIEILRRFARKMSINWVTGPRIEVHQSLADLVCSDWPLTYRRRVRLKLSKRGIETRDR